jgi:hypothetical protein
VSATTVKAGDTLYAVGPGHHAPQGPMDLCVYSTIVKNVRLEGSDLASRLATRVGGTAIVMYTIELNDDRPVLGFPKWTYRDYEVGLNIHLSAADAIRTFAAHAQQRRDASERAREHAAREVEWATTQANALGIHKLDKGHDLDMPPGLNDAGQRAHKIIVEYLKKHDLTNTGGCKAFYAPAEWKEQYGDDSHLVVVYDGGDMRPVFSMDAAYEVDCAIYQETRQPREPYSLYEGMLAALREAGLYFEECTGRYSAVYSVESAASAAKGDA